MYNKLDLETLLAYTYVWTDIRWIYLYGKAVGVNKKLREIPFDIALNVQKINVSYSLLIRIYLSFHICPIGLYILAHLFTYFDLLLY